MNKTEANAVCLDQKFALEGFSADKNIFMLAHKKIFLESNKVLSLRSSFSRFNLILVLSCSSICFLKLL